MRHHLISSLSLEESTTPTCKNRVPVRFLWRTCLGTGIPGLLTHAYAYWVEELPDGSFIAAGAGRDTLMTSTGIYLMNISTTGNLLWWKCFDFLTHRNSLLRIAITGRQTGSLRGDGSSSTGVYKLFHYGYGCFRDSLWTVRLKRNYANRAAGSWSIRINSLCMFIHCGIRIIPDQDSGEFSGKQVISLMGFILVQVAET